MKVYFEDDWRCTVDVWTGAFESVVNFTNGLMLVLDNIREFRSRKWLTDLRKIDGDFSFSNPFMSEMMVPRAIHYGLEFEALVVPDSIFSRMTPQETFKKVNKLEIQIFNSLEDATDWLNEKITTPLVFRSDD